MIIDKQGKLFGKISIIDIVALIAVVVLAAGAYVRFGRTDNTNVDAGASSSAFEFDIEVSKVRAGTIEALNAGGPVTDLSTKEEMGEIVSVSAGPAYDSDVMADGTYRYAEIPQRYNATVTVRVNGKVSPDGFYTRQNKQITAGSGYSFTSKLAQTSGVVSAVREISE